MDRFKENYCRLCREVFCCVKCRRKHESQIHNVNPDCDICVHGRVVLRELPFYLLDHIETQHWPLHCLKCKRRFESIDGLIHHNKCPAGLVPNGNGFMKNPPGILVRSAAELRYDSPPLSDFHKNMQNPNIAATSTPTPRNIVDEEIESKVTPVNDIEKSKLLSRIGSTPNDLMKNEQSKRRVTFCETPILEYSGRKQLLTAHKSESIAEENAVNKTRGKLLTTVSHNLNEDRGKLTGNALEISVSPLIKKEGDHCDSPETETDGHKSIIAGSNQYFFCKQKNIEAVTSTPRLTTQEDRIPEENIKIETPSEPAIQTENNLDVSQVKTPDNVTPNMPHAEMNTHSDPQKKEERGKCQTSFQTPVMSVGMKQKQLLAATKQFTGEKTSMFHSLSSLKETPCVDITNIPPVITEENENLHNELVDKNFVKNNIQIEETLWMSAVNNLDCSQDENDINTKKTPRSTDGVKQSEIVSVCVKKIIHMPQNAVGVSTDSYAIDSSKMDLPKASLWTSVTQAINSVVTGLSMLNKSGLVEQRSSSSKRSWDDIDEEAEPETKRLKITDIKCRRTIRPICPLSHSVFKIMVDKATQTD